MVFKKAFPLALLVLMVVTFVLYGQNRKSTTPHELVFSVLEKCKRSTNTLNFLDSDCVYRRFQKSITKDNLGAAVNAMENIFPREADSKRLGTTSCHIPAHIAGEVAFQKGVTFNQVLEICETKCGFGCLHGAFQGMFKESGKNLIDELDSACLILDSPSDDDVRACWHIVGHGVGEYFGANLEGAIQSCVGLPEEKQRWHCISGLRMEHVTPSPGNYETALFSSIDGYLEFCAKFPSKEGFQDDCYAEAGHAAYKIFSNAESAVEICNKIVGDPSVKRRCAGGAGGVFYFSYKDDPEAIYSFCRKYQKNELVEDCILGATEVAATEDRFRATGLSLCRLAGGAFEKECLSFFGGKIERWYSPDERLKFCGDLPETDKFYCLSAPKNSREYYLPPD